MSRRNLRAVVATGIYPPEVGGPATHTWELCTEWHKASGIDASVVTLHNRGERHPVAPWRVRSLLRTGPLVVQLLKRILVLAAESRRADVVYATGLHLEAAIATMLTRRPLVVKVPGDPVWERARRSGATTLGFDEFQGVRSRVGSSVWLMTRARAFWLARARAVVVPSQYIGRIVESWGVPPHKTRVIYNGHTNDFAPPPDLAGQIRLLYIGRLTPHKRVEILLATMQLLPQASLDVVGSGPEDAALRRLVDSLAVGDRVCFRGAVHPDEVAAALASAHVVVNAAEYEGLPHSLLEALATGRPVVATDAGGTAEIVVAGKAGMLLPIDATPRDFADAVTAVVQSPEQYERFSRGAAEVVASATVTAMADRVHALLVASTDVRQGT